MSPAQPIVMVTFCRPPPRSRAATMFSSPHSCGDSLRELCGDACFGAVSPGPRELGLERQRQLEHRRGHYADVKSRLGGGINPGHVANVATGLRSGSPHGERVSFPKRPWQWQGNPFGLDTRCDYVGIRHVAACCLWGSDCAFGLASPGKLHCRACPFLVQRCRAAVHRRAARSRKCHDRNVALSPRSGADALETRRSRPHFQRAFVDHAHP